MPGIPQRINFCPITPECSRRSLYITVPLEEVKKEHVFGINPSRELVPHECTIRGTQGKPVYIYLGEFKNKRTKRTRYMGPFRTRAQAEKTPKDDKLDPRRRGSTHAEWELVKTHVVEADWKPAPPLKK